MCVIAFASAGMRVKMSSLKNCFDSNPHGAGIMWRDGTAVHVHKGFMSWEAFAKAYNEVPVQFDRAFHFRIMSSGEVKPENCHPFTVDMERVLTYTTTRLTIMHNGVMHEYEDPKLPWPDTVNYLRKNEKEFPNMPQVWGNKFLFMTPTQTVMIGDGWEMPDDENVWYSNNSYEDCSWDVDWYRVEKKHEDKFGFVDEPKEDTTGDFPLDECSGDCHTCKHWSECWTGEKEDTPVQHKTYRANGWCTKEGKDVCPDCHRVRLPREDEGDMCPRCKNPELCSADSDEVDEDIPQHCYGDCHHCKHPELCTDTSPHHVKTFRARGQCDGACYDCWHWHDCWHVGQTEFCCPDCGVPMEHKEDNDDDDEDSQWWVCPKCSCVFEI